MEVPPVWLVIAGVLLLGASLWGLWRFFAGVVRGSRSGQVKPWESRAPLIAVSILAVLYLWVFIESLIPRPEGSWISNAVPFDPWDREQIFVKLLFLLFLVGYFAAWKNERTAGIIFVLWWAAVWAVELFVMGPDGGMGIVMGLPIFLLGILFWRAPWRSGR